MIRRNIIRSAAFANGTPLLNRGRMLADPVEQQAPATRRTNRQAGAAGAPVLMGAKLLLVLALGALIVTAQGHALTRHMAAHIMAMSVVAPIAAWLLRRHWPGGLAKVSRQLLTATVCQLSVFALWHSPLVMKLSMHSPVARALMLVVLMAAAIWFWSCVFRSVERNRLGAVAALLITGKLVCLLAVLLVFAPRVLYPGVHAMPGLLGDQQGAGLLMLAVCPLTYVGASIYVVARWFHALSSSTSPLSPHP